MAPTRCPTGMTTVAKPETKPRRFRVDLPPSMYEPLVGVGADPDKSTSALAREYLAHMTRVRPFRPFTLILANGFRVDVRNRALIAYAGGQTAGVMDEGERACIIDVDLIVAIVRRHIGMHGSSSAGPRLCTGSGTGWIGMSAIETEVESRFTPYVDMLPPGTNSLLFECLSARAKSAEIRGRARDAISELEVTVRQSAATVRRIRGVPPFPIQLQSPELN
jgi:hypothetical protein